MKINDFGKLGMLVLVFCLFSFPSLAFAQEIPITISQKMKDLIFDGKWTFVIEWKGSSLNSMRGEDEPIYIRTAHYENYIYVLLDVISDRKIDNNDFSIVCMSTIADNSTESNVKQYCFKAGMGKNEARTLKWFNEQEKFIEIKNHNDLVSIGSISDENDYYTKIPHASYEYRIPLDLFGRYDKYDFFVGVYDSAISKSFTWPQILETDLTSEIPSSQKWGIIFSPDKSLPEFEIPLLMLFLSLFSIVIFTSKFSGLRFSSLR